AQKSLYEAGILLNFNELFKDFNPIKVDLPTYTFDKTRYWPEILEQKSLTQPHQILERHPLLGHKTIHPKTGDIVYESFVTPTFPEFIPDHCIYKHPVLAGASYISSLLSAAKEYVQENGLESPILGLKDIEFTGVFILDPTSKGRTLQTFIDASSQELQVQVSSFGKSFNEKSQHLNASLYFEKDADETTSLDVEAFKQEALIHKTGEDLAQKATLLELDLKNHFRWIEEVWLKNEKIVASFRTPFESESNFYVLYPGLIDSLFQSFLAFMQEKEQTIAIPFGIKDFWCDTNSSGVKYLKGSISKDSSTGAMVSNFGLFDEFGSQVGGVLGFVSKKAPKSALLKQLSSSKAEPYYEIRFEEDLSDFEEKVLHKPWILSKDQGDLKDDLLVPATLKDFKDVLSQNQEAQGLVVDLTKEFDPSEALDSQAKELLKSLLTLTQTLVKENFKLPVYLVTKGAFNVLETDEVNPLSSMISGYVKTLNLETPELDCRHLDLNNPQDLLKELSNPSKESQLVYRDSKKFLPKLKTYVSKNRLLTFQDHGDFYLSGEKGGSFDTLTLSPRTLPNNLKDHEVIVKIEATGLNFRDVLNALNQYPGDPGLLGGDCSGIVEKVGPKVTTLQPGDEVMGYALGAFASRAMAHEFLLTKKPKTLDFVQAAAVPTIFMTSHYALNTLAGLKKGQKVLIHAAAGGVGLSAIQYAQRVGAEIYATASKTKWDLLKSLGIPHLYTSRDTSFRDLILKDTNGQGVDVILNSLSSEGFIEASTVCLKESGTFLEIGKRNIWTPEEMRAKRPDATYHIIAIDTIAEKEPLKLREILSQVSSDFEQKGLHPISTKVYGIDQTVEAFSYMKSGSHTGKIVIVPKELGTFNVDETGVYLITGGFGALGFENAKWLVEKGAKHLVLVGRKGASLEQQEVLKTWRDHGLIVEEKSLDISNEKAVFELIDSTANLKGVIHTAGVLSDASVLNQTLESFEKVMEPKILGSWHLVQSCLKKDLDFMVLYSSIASSIGSPGQLNYATANSFMDGLAEYATSKGLKTLSINWGPWKEVGMASALVSKHEASGFTPLKLKDGLNAQESLLLNNKTGSISYAPINWEKVSLSFRDKTPEFLNNFIRKKSTKEAQKTSKFLEKIFHLSDKDKEKFIKDLVIKTIKNVLQLSSAQEINPSQSLFELGVDSLMAIDIKNKLQQTLGDDIALSATLLFDYPSVEKLSVKVLELIGSVKISSNESKKHLKTTLNAKEPIVIIGMSCRFPNGANSLEKYWDLLSSGKDGVTDIPSKKWDIDEYYGEDPNAPGKMTIKRLGSMEGYEYFDASFFGISPKEAMMLDPQQRLLLETTWEALERANIDPKTVKGKDVGVFMGISSMDYSSILAKGSEKEANAYMNSGNTLSGANGRISYFFGLEGPSLAIDTACSSSLVALNSAVLSLQQGECSMSVVGGVNLILDPRVTIGFSHAHMLSPDG
ncbi:MAG TPA: SDR family NAD(P)-dependent oxidoreductase, partial [Alphaproteobacteria bacterium]|nr:SDR family NAD(P)-dependent oxidoreductase [Alphaproteobacteria bacterium]